MSPAFNPKTTSAQPSLTYSEFGVEMKVSAYRPVGAKLAGLKEGKPFVRQGKILVNDADYLNEVLAIEFFSQATGEQLAREQVKLDTDVRVAAIIIREGEQLLIVQRLKQGKEYYVFPGGHLQEGESPEASLIREIKEETGLEIVVESIEFFSEKIRTGFGIERYYFCQPESWTLRENAEWQNTADKVFQPQYWDLLQALQLTNLYPREVVTELMSKLTKRKINGVKIN